MLDGGGGAREKLFCVLLGVGLVLWCTNGNNFLACLRLNSAILLANVRNLVLDGRNFLISCVVLSAADWSSTSLAC